MSPVELPLKDATASSFIENKGPENVLEGNAWTADSSTEDVSWLQLELKSPSEVVEVETTGLVTENGNELVTAYTIDVSSDGETYYRLNAQEATQLQQGKPLQELIKDPVTPAQVLKCLSFSHFAVFNHLILKDPTHICIGLSKYVTMLTSDAFRLF